MDERNAIEVRNMSKYFKKSANNSHTLKGLFVYKRGKKEINQVLNNINLDIRKGETVALIGTNGSGKSTLLKLMTKIIFPNSGTIETQGKLTSLLELGAGFHQDFTGRENIYFNASIFGLTKKEIEERLPEIIAFSELGDFIDQPIRTYSSGMYMRLAFSVAINVDAEILLIDEILAVGDQYFQNKCFKKLEELRDSSKTIVIVSHSLEVVKKLCKRAVWIYKGEFKLDGDPTYVIDEYLKQIAIDHKEEAKKAREAGGFKHTGHVFVDTPNDFSNIKQSSLKEGFVGWEISNCEESQFEILIDGQPVPKIQRVMRQDVYDAFREDYAGFVDPETAGWKVVLEDLPCGEHELSVVLKTDEGTLLAERDVVFKVIEG